ncbi:MAG TPA: 3-deoxy-manno-octulosonate cytidylyltransferase [Candidatus Thioglobus sp.]|jgi:3-deoxy-manno-octulosonate cytidylyltransferase (CMP-KDO synthetase)|nr:3-deoxy-manno-octulosonate cytidylyltransferase [Candidatus Thioglobus sp.]HIL20231.1 3-deoxy-manno-octulosonate cytidylyltransferase [Candidatus Thioglobus sp.]
MDFSVIIPARYASARLPGKPLKNIHGKTLIEHTYSNAILSAAKRVIIATDDERISDVAKAFGAEVCLTSNSHISGTSRIAEAVEILGFANDEIIVNVQGDEPMLSPAVIDQVAINLDKSKMDMATLCEQIETEDLYFDPNCVKVVYNMRGKAMYFSRSPIPAFRNAQELDLGLCFRHIGIYAYRAGFLSQYAQLSSSRLEGAEKLEQLTILNEGFDIHVAPTCGPTGFGVDTQHDLDKVIKELKNG